MFASTWLLVCLLSLPRLSGHLPPAPIHWLYGVVFCELPWRVHQNQKALTTLSGVGFSNGLIVQFIPSKDRRPSWNLIKRYIPFIQFRAEQRWEPQMQPPASVAAHLGEKPRIAASSTHESYCRNTQRENSGVVDRARREWRLFIPAAARRVAKRFVQVARSKRDLDLTEVNGVCGQSAGYQTAGLDDHRYLGIDSPADQINLRRTNIKAFPKRKRTGIFVVTKIAITGPLAVAGSLSGSGRLLIGLTCRNSAMLVLACCSDSQYIRRVGTLICNSIFYNPTNQVTIIAFASLRSESPVVDESRHKQ